MSDYRSMLGAWGSSIASMSGKGQVVLAGTPKPRKHRKGKRPSKLARAVLRREAWQKISPA